MLIVAARCEGGGGGGCAFELNQSEAPRSVSNVELTGQYWTTSRVPENESDYYYDCSALCFTSGSESQEAAIREGLLFVGERDGLRGVPYIAPERDSPILAALCNASDGSLTHPWPNGPGATDTHGASCRDVGACCPPACRGEPSKKSLWN